MQSWMLFFRGREKALSCSTWKSKVASEGHGRSKEATKAKYGRFPLDSACAWVLCFLAPPQSNYSSSNTRSLKMGICALILLMSGFVASFFVALSDISSNYAYNKHINKNELHNITAERSSQKSHNSVIAKCNSKQLIQKQPINATCVLWEFLTVYIKNIPFPTTSSSVDNFQQGKTKDNSHSCLFSACIDYKAKK